MINAPTLSLDKGNIPVRESIELSDYLDYMNKYHSSLFSKREERFYASRKWYARKRLERIIASAAEIHKEVQIYLKSEAEKPLEA